MKKMLMVIAILLIIFVGMLLTKNRPKSTSNVTAEEVQNIQEYLASLYTWKEVTGEAIPNFQTLEEAPDKWVWEVVKKNLKEYELTYEQIEEKVAELLGKGYKKEFPKEGNESFFYQQETNKYIPSEVNLDREEDSFLIDTIQKTNDGYEVEMIEYLEEYTDGQVVIKTLTDDTIAQIASSESNSRVIELVKQSKERFTKKKITLKIGENEQIEIQKVES